VFASRLLALIIYRFKKPNLSGLSNLIGLAESIVVAISIFNGIIFTLSSTVIPTAVGISFLLKTFLDDEIPGQAGDDVQRNNKFS
jgi:hypothetical protein